VVVVVAVILASLAGAGVLYELRRRREVRRGLQALTQLLLLRAHLQDRRWTLAADKAVLLAERPGRMREVVGHAILDAPGPVSVPGQRHAEPARVHTAAGAGRAGLRAAKPTFGRLSDNLLVGGAVGAAGLADWWDVDASVLKAVEALTHEHIGNTLDLWSTVHEHHYHLGEALFTSLRGHVGEQMAAEHLAQAGLQVEWPGASNQPGWDLGVGQHVMNIKVTANAANTLSEHFGKYPHIPALVNVDASHIPHDAVLFDPTHGLDPSTLVGDHLTLVDQALSLHDAASAVHDAFGVDVLADAHIPVVGVLVTVVRSGMREGKLLSSGDTDQGRALKNVAVDAATRGGGVMAGGAAGAAAGAHVDLITGGLTMGLGTVIGGIAGAIAGAMGGSAVASHVRHQPLREAQDSTTRALETYAALVESQQAHVEAKVDEAQKAAQATLTDRAKLATAQVADDIERARKEVRLAAAFDAHQVLADSFADLESRCDALNRLLELEGEVALSGRWPGGGTGYRRTVPVGVGC